MVTTLSKNNNKYQDIANIAVYYWMTLWRDCTCILPGIKLSAAVKMSCLVLWLSGEARITLPAPEPSVVVRMNCCLGAVDGFIAVTIWIF